MSDAIPARRWRPELTPYRALVLSTTLGLGSAKAYATSRDSALLPTTTEWIAATALLNIFFILAKFESSPPPCFSYLFEHDLTPLAARSPLFRLFCRITRLGPDYFTDKKKPAIIIQHTTNIHTQRRPPFLTGYRLLTSVSVTSFGLVEAYLVYQDTSHTPNAVDWISGVLLTSCLYVLGLYQDNPAGLMPYLFSFDYSPPMLFGLAVTLHLFGLPSCYLWARFWFSEIPSFPDFRAIYNGTDKIYLLAHSAPTTTLQGTHNLANFVLGISGTFFLVSMAVPCFIVICVKLFKLLGKSRAFKWIKAGFAVTCETSFAKAFRTTRLASWLKILLRSFPKVLHFFRCLTIHILGYTIGALLSGAIAFSQLGSISSVWFDVESHSWVTYMVAIYATIILGISFPMMGCLCLYLLASCCTVPIGLGGTGPIGFGGNGVSKDFSLNRRGRRR